MLDKVEDAELLVVLIINAGQKHEHVWGHEYFVTLQIFACSVVPLERFFAVTGVPYWQSVWVKNDKDSIARRQLDAHDVRGAADIVGHPVFVFF